MEDIVKAVIDRLKSREISTFFLSADTDQVLNEQTFLRNKYLHIKNCDSFFLERFANKQERDPLVKWLFKSFDYDCRLKLQCSFSNVLLIPEKLFFYDIDIFTADNKPCFSSSSRYITYEQAAVFPIGAVLILAAAQRLTWLAAEQAEKKQIMIYKRSGSQC